jgi:NADH dehydrogenase
MKIEKICVLGGTGFVGKHLVARLANSGHQVTVLTRRRERHRENLVLPNVCMTQARLSDSDGLVEHFKAMDAVIFLPGILNESGGQSFRDVHVELPRRVSDACVKARVKRILHMSALNADAANGPSEYLRTKGEGEDIMHLTAGAGIAVSSFRPSVIFGPDDSFFNRFAGLLKLSPVIPLACAAARFAPVYIGDVVDAFARATTNEKSFGKRLELCGPDAFSLQEIVHYTARHLGLKRLIVPLNEGLSRMMAGVLQFAPGKPMTPDNFLSMKLDSVCRENGFETLGIHPHSVDSIMPAHLSGRARRGRNMEYRRHAGR